MCSSFQKRSISDESAKLCGLLRSHGWVKKLCQSCGSCGFIKLWRGSKMLNLRMCMSKLQLNFSDFCKYSCIQEINYPKKKHIKILDKSSRFPRSVNFEKRLTSYISEHCFLNHCWETDQISKAVPLICDISLPLHK